MSFVHVLRLRLTSCPFDVFYNVQRKKVGALRVFRFVEEDLELEIRRM